MDTVRAAFVRWVALEKWREIEDLQTTLGFDLAQAVKEAGRCRAAVARLSVGCGKLKSGSF